MSKGEKPKPTVEQIDTDLEKAVKARQIILPAHPDDDSQVTEAQEDYIRAVVAKLIHGRNVRGLYPDMPNLSAQDAVDGNKQALVNVSGSKSTASVIAQCNRIAKEFVKGQYPQFAGPQKS